MKASAILTLLACATAALAQENRYDVVSKTLMPFLSVLSKDAKEEGRAFALKVRIESASALPEESKNAHAEITVQGPDKLRLHGPLLGETFTLARNGDKLWIAPGAKARALLDAAVAGRELPPPDKKFKLRDFRLPFPEKQLVFVAALLTIKDVGVEPLDGVECRAMDLTLMPELAKSLDAEGWVARLWVRPDHKPARLTLARNGWHIVLRFEDVEFGSNLPDGTWAPEQSEASDVLDLEPKDYSRFLRAIGGLK